MLFIIPEENFEQEMIAENNEQDEKWWHESDTSWTKWKDGSWLTG